MAVHHQFSPNHHHHRRQQNNQNADGGEYANNNNNPYALFRVCCTTLYTKDHAQLCGVVSFSLFLCLVVISLMFFGSLSIFYIVSGVIVYSLLMKSLFGLAEKSYVLFYLLFEAVQIGFHLALILYYLLPVIFSQLPSKQCDYFWTVVNGTKESLGSVCKELNLQEEYMELLLFIIILVSVKLYFARVFAHFYKYLVWNDKFVLHTAQYINGRGMQISALEGMFPPPPPNFWDYGYDQRPLPEQGRNQQMINVTSCLPAQLPSYSQICEQQQHKPIVPREMPAEKKAHQNVQNAAHSSLASSEAMVDNANLSRI